MKITATVEDAALQAKLSRAIAKAGSPDAFLTEWGSLVERDAKDSYPRRQQPGGAAWAALAPSTVRQKGGAGDIKRETGASAASYAAKPPSGNSIEVGSEGVFYEIFHHTGTSKMAARKSLPTPEHARSRGTAPAQRFIRRLLT